MLRKTMLALGVLALFGLAAAQDPVAPTSVIINPTLGDGADVIAKAGVGDNDRAVVAQTVFLDLPKATALHLAASTITFNLADLDGPAWEARARGEDDLPAGAPTCVYVSGADYPAGANVWADQPQMVPGGIGYAPVSWDTIKLVYIGNNKSGDVHPDELVVTYPPIRIDPDGLVEGSKDYFVCYQSFVIQLFSNFENFQLQVARADLDTNDQPINHLYVQGNTCAEFGAGTGLYALDDGDTLDLLPRALTEGPTGSRNTSGGCNPNSSWMDVLGVLAVKVNSDLYGPSTANLTYTLISSDATF